MINTRLALCDYSGLLVDLTQKFSGDNGPLFHDAIKLTLRGLNPYQDKPAGQLVAPVQILSAKKTIRIGKYPQTKDFVAGLQKNGNNVSNQSLDIMSKARFMLSQGEENVDLWWGPASELGFTDNYTHAQLIQRATTHFNLDRCQAQDGPYLRDQYDDQPNGEWLLTAMDTISDSDADLRIFYVVRYSDGKRWLFTEDFDPGLLFNPEYLWVFRVRK